MMNCPTSCTLADLRTCNRGADEYIFDESRDSSDASNYMAQRTYNNPHLINTQTTGGTSQVEFGLTEIVTRCVFEHNEK